MTTIPKVIIPGYGGSGPDHWQTHWETDCPSFARITPKSFDAPDLTDWLAALEETVARQSSAPILVAHSLGCLLVAEFLNRTQVKAAGAFMVAVPDPEGPNFPMSEAADFANFPRMQLPCPTLIISSEDDPYCDAQFISNVARVWGAEMVNVGKYKHISDVGPWAEGRKLLTAFGAGLIT